MKTTTTAIEMVINAGVKTAGEIRLFVMETRAITIDALKAGLVELGVEVPAGRKTKIVYADLFARALEMDLEDIVDAAAGETLVAEETTVSNQTTNKMEEMTMTNIDAKEMVQKEIQAIVNEKNLKALLASPISQGDAVDFIQGHTAYVNPALVDMLNKVNAAKEKYVKNVDEHEVVIHDIEFYNKPRQFDVKEGNFKGGKVRIVGDVTVQLPVGYAQVKVWNPAKVNSKGKLGAPEFVAFKGVDLNVAKRQYNMFRGLAKGNGFLVLPIMEFVSPAGEVSELTVSLPTEKAKNGTRYDIFRTSDARFVKTKGAVRKDEPLYLSDNNANFNAQVSAYVQLYANEFVKADPANNHAFNKTACSNMVRFQTKDGVSDDLNDSKKTRVILEQPDVMQLAQVGSEQPNTYCMVHDFFIDMEAVEILNDAETLEKGQEGRDEKSDTVRFQRHDEILIAGKLVKRNTVRESVIAKVCGACPNYCGNSPKTQSQITKEKIAAADAGEVNAYVNPFFREKAKAKAQVIQSLTTVDGKEAWVSKTPGEVIADGGDVMDVRVKGAGMSVYATEAVELDAEFVPAVETFDARHADIMKKINQVYYAAFNFSKLTESQIEIIDEMVENAPEMTDDEKKRWDNAVEWFKQAIQWEIERVAARNVEKFTTKFHTVARKGAVELDVDKVMGETMRRAEEGTIGYGLGYADLQPSEFVRYLDEVAIDYVYEVILNGTDFVITGDDKKDVALAAGALQEMLQKELTGNFYAFANGDYRDSSYATGIRRAEDPKAALEAFKGHKEVKTYLAAVCGLNK